MKGTKTWVSKKCLGGPWPVGRPSLVRPETCAAQDYFKSMGLSFFSLIKDRTQAFMVFVVFKNRNRCSRWTLKMTQRR
jgi:hypothetical protein